MNPLANILRPNTLDEIIGQKHLIGSKGVLRLMLDNHKISSMILYGEPGIGKTTLALVIANSLNKPFETFNASSDNKERLKKVISCNSVLIIDEIHRMKKDIQDYLLPYVERGEIIMIGLTTINPYRAVNPAIRSRATVYKLNPLSNEELLELITKTLNYIKKENKDFDLTVETKNYLIQNALQEARSLLNMIEVLSNTYPNQLVDIELATTAIMKPNLNYDKDTDGYYDTLSALHKSIRGSDVNASLHYLAKLLFVEDLLPLIRRLLAIAYEDISIANPDIGVRVKCATEAAMELGLPEAKLPLSSIVVEMALSPKSNSAYLAFNEAMSDIEKGNTGYIPKHLKNVYNFENKEKYLYPHDYPGAWVNQQYLPDELKNRMYYKPKTTSKYETALKERYDAINKAKGKL